MLKKTITYTDYNGSERTEDFYFNLSKAEIMEMEMGTTGGMAGMIQKIVSAQGSLTGLKTKMIHQSIILLEIYMQEPNKE